MFLSNDLRNLSKVATLVQVEPVFEVIQLTKCIRQLAPTIKKHSPGQYLGAISEPKLANLNLALVHNPEWEETMPNLQPVSLFEYLLCASSGTSKLTPFLEEISSLNLVPSI